MFSDLSSYTKKHNDYNLYLKAVPNEYVKIISKNVDENKDFQFGLIKDLELRELLIFKFINIKTNAYDIYHFSTVGVTSCYDFSIEIFKQSRKAVRLNKIKTKELSYTRGSS